MTHETKKKFALWMYPSTQEQILRHYKDDNCASQSEFIEKAIGFYCGYLNTQNAQDYLPKALSEAVTESVQVSENRLARLMFKLAVEMCMMMHVIAETTELPDTYLSRLRGRCVTEVKKSTGSVKLDKAVQTHEGLSEKSLGTLGESGGW